VKGFEMRKQRSFSLREVVSTIALVVVTGAVGLGLAGCNEQLTAIEQCQLDLQEKVHDSSQQMAQKMAAIERKQLRLQSDIETGTLRTGQIMAKMEKTQLGLQDEIGNHLTRVIDNIAVLESSQVGLRAGLEDNTQKLSHTLSNIDALERRLLRLQEMFEDVQDNTRNAAARVVVIEEHQLDLQRKVEGTVEHLTGNVERIEESMLKLQQLVVSVRNSSQQMAATMAAMQKSQNSLQDGIEGSLAEVLESIKAIDRSDEKAFRDLASEEKIAAEPAFAAADIDVDADAVE
jgi:chromosome segregation ATPase